MKVGIYYTLGDGGLEESVAILAAAAHAGASLLEVGLPFSDPLLDGPVIQASHTRALASGEYAWSDVCAAIASLRSRIPSTTQISVMTSAQLLYTESRRSALPTVDGILVTDIDALVPCPFPLPSKRVWFLSQDVALTAETLTPPEDVSMVYLTRLQGVTGEGQKAAPRTAEAVRRIRAATAVPIWLGFGISSRTDVAEAEKAGVDGAVIGSAFVRAMETKPAGTTTANETTAERAARWVKGVLPLALATFHPLAATLLAFPSSAFAQSESQSAAQEQAPSEAQKQPQNESQTEAPSEAQRFESSYTVEWINQGAYLVPREEKLNPNNVARVPTASAVSQLRPNVKLEFGRDFLFAARPRFTYDYSLIQSADTPIAGAKKKDSLKSNLKFRWQELFGLVTVGSGLNVTYGIQNYQWGSAESWSPTNVFYPEPQFDRGLYTENAGLEMVRANLSAGQWGSFIVMGKPAKKANDPSLALAKAEIFFNSGSDSIGLVAAGGSDRKPGFGETLSWNLSDALLLFAEGFHTREPDGLELREVKLAPGNTTRTNPASPGTATPPVILDGGAHTPGSRAPAYARKRTATDKLETTAVGGVRYGFSDGSEFRVEGIYNSQGMSRTGLADVYRSTEGATPLAAANTATLLASSQRMLAKYAGFGSIRVIDLPPKKSVTFYTRATVYPQDASYIALASLEYAWEDAATIFVTYLNSDARKDGFAMNLSQQAGTLGVKVIW